METDPIRIKVGYDLEEASRELREFVQSTQDAIERPVAASVEVAKKKLFELTQSYEIQQAVINENGTAIEALAAKRAKANAEEQAAIDAQIAKYKQVQSAHEQELIAIEKKRAKLESTISASLASTENEKLGIQLLTQERIRELASISDSLKAADAFNSARDRELARVDALKSKLEELNRLQSLTSDVKEYTSLEAKKTKAQEGISLAGAGDDEAERSRIKQVTDARLAELGVQRDQIKADREHADALERSAAATDKQKAKIEEIIRAEKLYQNVLDEDRKHLADLEAQKEKAEEEDKKKIDQEIINFKKALGAREDENRQIVIKRIRLEEVFAISHAGSEKEIADIKATTDARISEAMAERDVAKAQRDVRDSAEESASAIGDMVKAGLAFAGLTSGFMAIKEGLSLIADYARSVQQQMVATMEAADKLRGLSGDSFGKTVGFSNAFGIFDNAGEVAAQKQITSIAGAYQLPIDTVATTAASLAPTLKRAGITDLASSQFNSLVGNASLFAKRGIDSDNLSFFLQDQLGGNKNLTGDQFNQSVSNLIADSNGSPVLANQFLGIMSQDFARFKEAGMSIGDMQSVYRNAVKGNPAQEVPSLMRQYGQGLDRLLGLKRRDMLKMFGEVNSIPQGQSQMLDEMSQYMPDDRLGGVLSQAEKMRPAGTSLGGLDKVFEDAMKTGRIDVKAFQSAMATMSPAERERVARAVAGPRNVVAMGALMGTAGGATTNAPLMPITTNADELTAVQKEQANAQAAIANPADPGAAWYAEQLGLEKTHLDGNPDLYPVGANPNSNILAKGYNFVARGAMSKEELYAENVVGRRMVQLAKLANDIDTGKVKATPAQKKALQDAIGQLQEKIFETTSPEVSGHADFRALYAGVSKYGEETRADVLKNMQNDSAVDKWLLDNLNYANIGDEILDPKQLGPIFDNAKSVEDSIVPPRPAPKPPTTGPVSVNYHQRITNYGYGYDQIGAPQMYDNNLG